MKKCFVVLLFSLIAIFGTGSVATAVVYTVTNITNNSSFLRGAPQINDNGYVVWYGSGNLDPLDTTIDSEIFLYDGTTTTQITNNSYDDWYPQINDNGYVVWYGNDGSDDEIFLYDGTTTTQLTNNSYSDGSPQINDNGYVVWLSNESS